MNRRRLLLLSVALGGCDAVLGLGDYTEGDGSGSPDVVTMDVSSNDVVVTDAPGNDADAAAPFTPMSLTGLALWLDASKGVSATGNNVTSWQDQSGNGNNATQSTSSYEPLHVTVGINGKPSVHFTGGTHLTIADTASLQWGTGDFYVAFVLAETTASSTYGMVFSKQLAPYPFAGPGVFANFALPTQGTSWGGQTSYVDYVSTTSTMLNDGTPRQFSLARTGTTLSVRLNGMASASTVGAATDVGAMGTPVSMGANQSGGQALTGDIAEVIAVSGTVSPSDVANVEAYLKAKYSL